MMMKNKKIYMICLIACAATMVLGLLLLNIKAISGLGGMLYTISCILGVVVGSLRVYKDFLKWVFRKKGSKLIGLSVPAFIFIWMFRIYWWFLAPIIGLGVCVGLPAVSGIIAFLKYKDELVEV